MGNAAAAGRPGFGDGFGDGVRPGAWIGHHGASLLVASVLAMVALAVFPIPPDNPAAFVVPVGLLAVVVTSWVLLRCHDRSMCELCLRRMPLDPAARAQRHHRRLAVVHLGADRRVVAGYLVVLLGSNALLVVDSAWAKAAWALVQCSMIYLVMAHSTHRALQPWCPWCSDGGGGEELVDAPEPLPVGGRQT